MLSFDIGKKMGIIAFCLIEQAFFLVPNPKEKESNEMMCDM